MSMLRPQAHKRWPSGGSLDVAQIKISDEDLERLVGIAATRGFESGLGNWVGIGATLESLRPVEFIQYTDDILGGLYILRCDRSDDPIGVMDEVTVALSLQPAQIAWRRNPFTKEIDISEVSDAEVLHDCLIESLVLSHEYSRNFKSLFHCISDDALSCMPKHLIVRGARHMELELPQECKLLVKCLQDYQAVAKYRTVSFVS